MSPLLIEVLLYTLPMLGILLLYGPMSYSIWLNLYHPQCWVCGKRTQHNDIVTSEANTIVYQRACKACFEKSQQAKKPPIIQQWTLLDYSLDTIKQESIHHS